MATLTIATTFLNDYARLESRLQRRIGDLVTSFAQMLSLIHISEPTRPY